VDPLLIPSASIILQPPCGRYKPNPCWIAQKQTLDAIEKEMIAPRRNSMRGMPARHAAA
jgi:hypothetical protein